MNNKEEYLNECAEALSNYLNCDKEEIEINEDFDERIKSIFSLNDKSYIIATVEDVVDYIKEVLLPDKIVDIEYDLKRQNLWDYVEELDIYTIEEEIFENLEEYFNSNYQRIPFKYNKEEYLIFRQ